MEGDWMKVDTHLSSLRCVKPPSCALRSQTYDPT
jgi:hypothetical protein